MLVDLMRTAFSVLAIALLSYFVLAQNQKKRDIFAKFTKPGRSKETHDITACIRAFDQLWEKSFQYGYESRETVRHLYDLAADTQNALSSLKATFPNDLEMDRSFKELCEKIQENQHARIEDLKQRCGAPLLFPHSIEDLHYRKWWRAANDQVT